MNARRACNTPGNGLNGERGSAVNDNRAERYRLAGWWTGRRLIDRFEAHVGEGPGQLAVVSDGAAMSRRELWHAAGAAAEQIRSLAGTARRPVVILLPNCAEWMVMFLAVLRAGHVPATPPVTTPEAHLRHIFELIRPALVVCNGQGPGDRPSDAVRRAAAAAAGGPVPMAVAQGGRLALDGPPIALAVAADVPEITAHLMFTSSTTGPPKAVSHSEDSLAALNMQFAERFDLDQHTPVFMPSPLGHSVGAIHGCRLSLFVGAPLILQDEWDAQAALELVDRHGAEFTAAATPFLLDLADARWEAGQPKLASMRSFLCGGAQVPPALIRRCRAEMPNTFVTPLWGMTEGGLTTCVRASTESQVETTVGVGLPGLELRVVEADGVLHYAGSGELVMRGPGVFNGYYGQPQLYAAELVGDGWFRTGDLARIDADGYVSITGRLKDLIIRGAVNISPVETENAIAAHPEVIGVAVIGWPDERLGERICAAVHARIPLSLDDVLAYCAEQGLPRRYWPERLVHVDGFPRTAAGKIRKQQLRDELVAAGEPAEATPGSGAGPERDTVQ
ncbi:MAG: AMP-binding protein [Acidimicrobiales bacterium]|nr:AMP-binding protein [Acidimicrobiales bacterium]MYD84124.1 AMP-binding protein [Acidimicrobiales bacterium]MYJ65286.1 AMP-binding protein [Acidimicrobiales bacterium]